VASLQLVARDAIAKIVPDKFTELVPEQAVRLGKALGAQWLVWGDYQRLGDSIRMTGRFSNASSGETVHSCKVDGQIQEVFKLQDKIVTTFVDVIDGELSSGELEKIQQDETHEEKAYELYARARQRTNSMGVKDFEETKQLYERAIEIDPDYALAHSGLGNLYVFRFIAQTDPDDLEKGMSHLTRAIGIDPDIAEPHAYLGYYYSRKGDVTACVESLRKALELEENHVMANYTLGASQISFTEGSIKDVHEGVRHLKRAIELAPGHQPALMMLAWRYMLHGQYDAAMPLLERTVEAQRSQKVSHYKFVGGSTLYGNLLFRQRRLDLAQVAYKGALTELAHSDHMYAHMFAAQTHCGLGDVEFAHGNYDKAVKHYGQAVDSSNARPERLGIGYFYVRGCVGLSKSFFHLTIDGEARAKARAAADALREKSGHNYGTAWEAHDAQTYSYLASCQAVLQEKDEAIRCLSEAVRLGWRDLPQIEADEGLMALRDDPRFGEIMETVRKTEPLP
jgi:tetratricopeptide (TPR) repeat protein